MNLSPGAITTGKLMGVIGLTPMKRGCVTYVVEWMINYVDLVHIAEGRILSHETCLWVILAIAIRSTMKAVAGS